MADVFDRIKRIASGVKDFGVGSAMMTGASIATAGLRAMGSNSPKHYNLAMKGMDKMESGLSRVKSLGGDVNTYKKLNKK